MNMFEKHEDERESRSISIFEKLLMMLLYLDITRLDEITIENLKHKQ